MQDGLHSSRQSLRIQLRCDVTVAEPAAIHRGETIDVGPCGCRVQLRSRWPVGVTLDLRIASPMVSRPLTLRACVIWVSASMPWVHGLAWAPAWRAKGARWFDALTTASPELLFHGRVPDQIALDQRLVVAVAPEPTPKLAGPEAALLHHARGGATVRQLRTRLGGDWSASKRTLLGLIERGALSLDEAPDGDEPVGARAVSARPVGARGAPRRG